jgi:broad specificity phosphatase PhoE
MERVQLSIQQTIGRRQAATDQTQIDSDLSRCETQRNLDEQSRAEARAIGQAVRALGIPVGAVLSSGYCRTRDTAALAFGRAERAKRRPSRRAAESISHRSRVFCRPIGPHSWRSRGHHRCCVRRV